MSVHVSSTVWRSSSHGGSALLVLLALADQADDDGWCFPGVPYVAGKCRLSERAVRDNLARLEESGELERHPRPGRSNFYRVVTRPAPATPADVAGVRPPAVTPAAGRTPPLRGAAPITTNEPSTPDPAGPGDSAPAPCDGIAHRQTNGAQCSLCGGRGMDARLEGMPEVPGEDARAAADRWDGGVVVAAWVDGYRSSHDGADPLPAVLRRVAGSAKQAAKDVGRIVDREAILEVAYIAGAQVRHDVVAALSLAAAGKLGGGSQGRPATLSPASKNAAILARAADRAAGAGGGDDGRE